jgi:hypothetical protein
VSESGSRARLIPPDPLKCGPVLADPALVRDGTCPICDADVPMSGDESVGETVYCAYCEAPLRFSRMSVSEVPMLTEEDEA